MLLNSDYLWKLFLNRLQSDVAYTTMLDVLDSFEQSQVFVINFAQPGLKTVVKNSLWILLSPFFVHRLNTYRGLSFERMCNSSHGFVVVDNWFYSD